MDLFIWALGVIVILVLGWLAEMWRRLGTLDKRLTKSQALNDESHRAIYGDSQVLDPRLRGGILSTMAAILDKLDSISAQIEKENK